VLAEEIDKGSGLLDMWTDILGDEEGVDDEEEKDRKTLLRSMMIPVLENNVSL